MLDLLRHQRTKQSSFPKIQLVGQNKSRMVRLSVIQDPWNDPSRSRRSGTFRGNAWPTNFRDQVNIHETISAGLKHGLRGILQDVCYQFDVRLKLDSH